MKIRKLLTIIGLGLLPEISYGEVAINDRWAPTDAVAEIDARCAGLYLALEKLSMIGKTGNAESYRESATFFTGFAIKSTMTNDHLPQGKAEELMVPIVKRSLKIYWELLMRISESPEDVDPMLESDIHFCLDRGEAYANGQLP